ncbi:hypothetical protein MHU86_2231 [Fragilaria crotonensis]|nr:hypothetical protein MHU86_2231 [Fragilaria crotonensis]
MKVSLAIVTGAVVVVGTADAFVPVPGTHVGVTTSTTTTTSLNGLFDNWQAQGSGKDRLDEQWEQQQEILKARRLPKAEREKYFQKIEESRQKASEEYKDKWAWQTKNYGKGEDPLTEWKKRRADGTISDLENQYGEPSKIGGIPLPMASFGVGGEFGVGGKFDNGGRFDLRLPYADQGYVDDDADVMGKLAGMFGGNKKKATSGSESPAQKKKQQAKKVPEPAKKKWPWEQ